MMAFAISAGMPDLGQQRRIENRPNLPGERLKPREPKKQRRLVTDEDRHAMDLAVARRARKSAFLLRQWTGPKS